MRIFGTTQSPEKYFGASTSGTAEKWPGRAPTPTVVAGDEGSGRRGFDLLLESFRTKLETALQAWLEHKQTKFTEGVPEADELTGNLARFLFRQGKRLRPALIYYAYRGCGGSSDQVVMPVAMAVELLHTYLLIHDDIMDRAELRRGEPSAHVLYRDLHRARGWAGSSSHFGESVAILLGDLAQTYSVELFASVEADPGVRRTVGLCYTAMCEEVIVGQYLEMTAGYRQNLSEEELLRVLQMKSGRYSVERPIQLGALLAGASESTLQALTAYGAKMGEAFQLQDDLLGMFGDAARVGKPVGADLAEGKFTMLIHHTLRRVSPGDRRAVLAALGKSEVSAREVERVQSIIEESGARRRVVEMVEERMATALEALAGLELEGEGEEFFRGLIDYLRGRER